MITIAAHHRAPYERAWTASQESCVPDAIVQLGGTLPIIAACGANPSNIRHSSQGAPAITSRTRLVTVPCRSHAIQSP